MSATLSPAIAGELSIRSLHKEFGGVAAIKDLDLDIRAGEFLCLLGPSGCGKTTLLRMIAGFEEPTAGVIELGSTDLTRMPAHKRPVNTVFQAYALFPHMTVAENVAYGLKQSRTPKKEIGQRVDEALTMVRMREFADRSPGQLSGGQQQRVALARALVNRPKVLLLDEPMSALDRKLREEMQVELKLLQKRLGITFIFVTHDQEEALAMSDRIVVMYDGRIQQVGSAEEVYTRPTNSFVAGFIGKQNFVEAVVVSDDGGALRLRSVNNTTILPEPNAAGDPGAAGRPVPSVGDTVRVAIRPETLRLRVADGVPSAPNAVLGRIAGVSFLGDVVQYVLLIGEDTEILSRVPRSDAVLLPTDEDVLIEWDGADVAVYCDEA